MLFLNDFKAGAFGNDRPRIYIRNRNFPGCGITRSFGDYLGHKIGMTSEPVVGATKITKSNKFLIIASRALWNVMTPKEVF
jgi:serine/threonine protein phosphatase PrpC